MVMREIARNALTHVLGAKPGERILVVTDEQRIEIGNAFYEASDQLKLEGRLFVLGDHERPLDSIPHDLQRAMEGADVMVNVFVAYPEETPFRIIMLEKAVEGNARVGHGPGITDDMMLKGAMRVDFEALNAIGDEMLQRVKGAVRAHVTSPAGTDLWLTLRGREFDTDVRINPGTLGNLPNGELWVAPIETEAQGTLVCDGSIGDLGPVTEPVTIEVVAGRITSILGEDGSLVERVRELTSVDEQGAVVGELGFGINPAARIVGIMLEDEKVAGTTHVAFGNNIDMPGGQNSSSTHREFLIREASLSIEFDDGQTRDIIRDGHLLD